MTYPRESDVVYVRCYARRVGVAPNPHRWVRYSAAAGCDSSGRAGTAPPGDRGFWFDLDLNNDDAFFFYVYWHAMRSGRCNDGGATPGCEGDQGVTYYYGNVFRPGGQQPMPRGRWVCIEVMAKANRVGDSDGELAPWIDGEPVGRYRKGQPRRRLAAGHLLHAPERVRLARLPGARALRGVQLPHQPGGAAQQVRARRLLRARKLPAQNARP